MLKSWILVSALGALVLVTAAAALVLVDSKQPPTDRWAARNTMRYERIDLIEAVHDARPPEVGEEADFLNTKDEVGARFNLQGTLKQGPVLLGAFCTCPSCQRTAAKWNDLLRKHRGRFAAAAFMPLPEGPQLTEFDDQHGILFSLLPDPNHALSARFPGPGQGSEALRCPRVFVIGTDGRFRYVMPMGSEPTPKVMRAIQKALGLSS